MNTVKTCRHCLEQFSVSITELPDRYNYCTPDCLKGGNFFNLPEKEQKKVIISAYGYAAYHLFCAGESMQQVWDNDVELRANGIECGTCGNKCLKDCECQVYRD